MKKHLFPLSAALLLAAACTPPHTPKTWRAPAAERHTFTAAGRLAVKQNEKGSYANFEWTRGPTAETISINTPLGSTLGELCQDTQGVTAADAKGNIYTAATPEELRRQLLGYQIPVQYLATWAHGEYISGIPHSTAADGSLNQLGWNIRRQTAPDGSIRLLELQNDTLAIRMAFSSIGTYGGGMAQCPRTRS